MNTFYDSHFKRKLITIYPGELYASRGPEFISTILGSCVSIVLFDKTLLVGGMNHFMLAYDNTSKNSFDKSLDRLSDNVHDNATSGLLGKTANKLFDNAHNATKNLTDGKFGQYAIDMLLERMEKLGSKRYNLQAKVFGGTNVFNLKSNKIEQVGKENIDFAFSYLDFLNIPIVAKDVGGNTSRKIIYDPQTFKVYLKRLDKSHR